VRLVPIIIALTAIAVSLVHIRRQQTSFAHEIQRLRNRHVSLRRTLWDQQAKLGYLVSPGRIQDKVDSFAGPLTISDASDEPGDEATAQPPADEHR